MSHDAMKIPIAATKIRGYLLIHVIDWVHMRPSMDSSHQSTIASAQVSPPLTGNEARKNHAGIVSEIKKKGFSLRDDRYTPCTG